jgi:hypothetical protein
MKAESKNSGDGRQAREELAEFLAEIGSAILSTEGASMHAVAALNHLLRAPDAPELFDDELKELARDLWLKIKSAGIQLNDPPLLFGYPPLSEEEASSETGPSGA